MRRPHPSFNDVALLVVKHVAFIRRVADRELAASIYHRMRLTCTYVYVRTCIHVHMQIAIVVVYQCYTVNTA